jgi:micrococcal nuclease
VVLDQLGGLVGAGALALIVLTGCTSDTAGSASADAGSATVKRVVDGDTLVLGDDTRVRLIGIDTPETVDPRRPVECFGHEASARMNELLPPGTSVELVFDVDRTDRYGRTLAYVYRAEDELFVNVAMARDGYAEQLTVPPNVAHADDISEAVEEARDAARGLWADGVCTAP